MNNCRRIASALALACISFSLCAQNVSVRGGSSTFVYEPRYFAQLWGEGVTPVMPVGTVKIGWEDYRESPYAVSCLRPEYGVAFSYDPIGFIPAVNGPGCGSIYGAYAYFDRPLVRTRRFSLEYSGGLGLGFVFRNLYDPVTNPWQVVISIPVNARICLGGQMKYMITDKYFVGLGVYLNHCSNGLVHLDNYGYNGIEVGLILGMKDVDGRESVPYDRKFGRHPYDDGFRRGFVFDAYASGGVAAIEAIFDRTKEVYHAPKYAFHADAVYSYCRTHATGLGADLFVTPYYDRIDAADGTDDGLEPVSVGVSLLHQMTYNRIKFMVAYGRYLYHNDGIYNRCKSYQMCSLKYYPRFADSYFCGVVLKAHNFMAAESIQLCLGKSF